MSILPPKDSGIYAIVHKSSNCKYIGSSANVRTRQRQHYNLLNSKKHHSGHLQNAWNKYGQDNFDFLVLEVVSELSRLIEREQFWIDALLPVYNSAPVAGSTRGCKRSAETKEKISNSILAKGNDPDYVSRKSSGIKAFWENNPEARDTASKSKSAQWQDPALKSAFSEALRKGKQLPECRENMRKASRKNAQNPEWKAACFRNARERAKDPAWRAKMSAAITKKAKDPEYRERLRLGCLKREARHREQRLSQNGNQLSLFSQHGEPI